MIENLAVASALGFLALVVAAISLAVDSREVADEVRVLVSAGAEGNLEGRCDDPSFCRMYRIQSEAGYIYATILTLRSTQGAFLVGATFSSKGELQGLRYIGSCASRQASDPRELVDAIPGASDALSRASVFIHALETHQAGRTS